MKNMTLEDEMPTNARKLWLAAEQHGWVIWATRATGTPIDDNGNPRRVTRRVPLVDTQTGRPLLSPTGKQRHEVVATEQVLTVDSVAIRLNRRGVHLAAVWEDGAFSTGLQNSPLRKLNSAEIVAAVTA